MECTAILLHLRHLLKVNFSYESLLQLLRIKHFTDVYLSLNGSILPNNSYVVINDIGTTERTSLLCHTDTPPMSGASDSGGDWVSPSGQVAGDTQVPGFEVDRDSMVVRLKRNYSQVPTEGMYHCLIESRAQAQQIIYAGLYLEGGGTCIIMKPLKLLISCCFSSSGDIEILGMTFTVDSDLNGASPQFTLSCISTGGPATTVAWTRDSTPVAEGNTTVLDDPVTARYIHNLIVNGRAEGVYSCTVANTKTSVASVSLNAAAAALNATNITSTSQGTFTVTQSPALTMLVIVLLLQGGREMIKRRMPSLLE